MLSHVGSFTQVFNIYLNFMNNTRVKKYKQSRKKSMMYFEVWLKEFEILFNLSTDLNKSQIEKLQLKFNEIVNRK